MEAQIEKRQEIINKDLEELTNLQKRTITEVKNTSQSDGNLCCGTQ